MANDPFVGTTVGRYRLLKRLAVGGMGEVYLASQVGPEGFQKVVVLKRMLPSMAGDEEIIRLFLDEARLVAKLGHRNIAQIFDLGQDEDGFFVVMEHVKGPSARRLLDAASRDGSRLSPALAIDIVSQVADALAYAYATSGDDGAALHIVHRDVTPENILISVTGDVKLIDFGVAKSAQQQHATQAGTVKGKLAYMSPEQSRGLDLDGRSDLFSLGIVFSELLCGKNPFGRADVLRTVLAIQSDPAQLPSATFPDLEPSDALFNRLLAKEPAERFADASELYDALQSMRGTFPPPPKRLGPFITEKFGADLAALIRSISDPEAQRAMRAGSGVSELLTPVTASNTAKPRAKLDDSAEEPFPETRVRAPDEEEVPKTRLRTPAATISPKARAPVRPPPKLQPPPTKVFPKEELAAEDTPEDGVEADAAEPSEAFDEATPSVQRTSSPKSRMPIAIGVFVGVIVLGGAGAWFGLKEPDTAPSPAKPIGMGRGELPVTSAPAETEAKPTPPAPALAPTHPEAKPEAPVAVVPPPSKPATPAPAPTPTITAPTNPKPAGKPSASNRPATVRPAGGAEGRGLAARFKRVKAAWESQRSARSSADVRLFDATLGGIQAAIKSGTPEDVADAKQSLDEFVRSALRGIEP